MKHIKRKYIHIAFLFFLNLLPFQNLHAQQFNQIICEKFDLRKNNIQEYIGSQKSVIRSAENDTAKLINAMLNLSMLNRVSQNYGSAFDYAGKALFLAEEFKDQLLLASSHQEFGVLSYLYKQDEQTGVHFKNALQLSNTLYSNNKIEKNRLYTAYYNMILYADRTDNYKLSNAYIDSCYQIAESTNMNPIYKAFLQEKQANSLVKQKKYSNALNLLYSAKQIIENSELNATDWYQNKSYLIILNTTIGNIYLLKGNQTKAQLFFKAAIDEQDLFGEHTFYKSYTLSKYASVLYKDKKFQQAFSALSRAKKINDQYLNPRNENNQDLLSLRNRYKDELILKNNELNNKNLELSINKQKMLRIRSFFIAFIFLTTLAWLIVRAKMKSRQYKNEKAALQRESDLKKRLAEEEKRQANIKAEKSREELDLKNKELTTTMLQLIEKEEIIKMLSDKLLESDNNKNTKAILASIKKQSSSLWDAFNSRFMEQNNNFYANLQAKVPDLSAADLRVCALIKLNFSSKEMANLLGISEGSVHVSRHRLRKKMALGRDTNLTSYIASI